MIEHMTAEEAERLYEELTRFVGDLRERASVCNMLQNDNEDRRVNIDLRDFFNLLAEDADRRIHAAKFNAPAPLEKEPDETDADGPTIPVYDAPDVWHTSPHVFGSAGGFIVPAHVTCALTRPRKIADTDDAVLVVVGCVGGNEITYTHADLAKAQAHIDVLGKAVHNHYNSV